jgi:hypothetical protein
MAAASARVSEVRGEAAELASEKKGRPSRASFDGSGCRDGRWL